MDIINLLDCPNPAAHHCQQVAEDTWGTSFHYIGYIWRQLTLNHLSRGVEKQVLSGQERSPHSATERNCFGIS
jgi:hypothetical protein